MEFRYVRGRRIGLEVTGLMQNRLYVDAPPAGHTRLTEWAALHADSLGRTYANELARRRPTASGSLR